MSTDATHPIQRIVVVGGGTAGWLTAGLLAREHVHPESPVSVTLIESPDVPTIGVGEGTWPTMRTTLRTLGIAEAEFLAHCTAAFKQGTRFVGWVTGADDDRYYHPFSAPAGYASINLAPYWQEAGGGQPFADAVGVQSAICERDLAPKQVNTPEYAGVVNYGYHLDAGRFAELLQSHCTKRLGVAHLRDHVIGINAGPGGDIRSLQTQSHGELPGDLFVDCTGFKSLLLGEHYEVPFIDRTAVLCNDRALAVQVPYTDPNQSVASQTIATARPAGWVWDIGLTGRRGIGHVYSSAHQTDEEAARVLQDYVGGDARSKIEPRTIPFRPGHRERFWHRNCVAVGLSAGFLEPLEASALVLVELSARMISEELPANREVMDVVAGRFNRTFRYRWDRIIDFLKLHYVLSRRDEAYWRDQRSADSTPDSLREQLKLWRHHSPWHRDFPQVDEVFSSASFQYVLYGMGFQFEVRRGHRYRSGIAEARELMAQTGQKTAQLLSHLPAHRALLNQLGQQGASASATHREAS